MSSTGGVRARYGRFTFRSCASWPSMPATPTSCASRSSRPAARAERRQQIPILCCCASESAPAEFWRDSAQHAVDQVRVVVGAELIGNGQQQCVGSSDRLVLGKLLYQAFRLTCIRFAESGLATIELTNLIAAAGLASEIGTVQVTDHREDAPADRDPWFACVSCELPAIPVTLDLLGLQLVERHAGVFGEQSRAHQVHPLLRRPLGGRP